MNTSLIMFSYSQADAQVKKMKSVAENLMQIKSELETSTNAMTQWKGKDNAAYADNVQRKAAFLSVLSQRISQRANQIQNAAQQKRDLELRKAREAAQAGSASV